MSAKRVLCTPRGCDVPSSNSRGYTCWPCITWEHPSRRRLSWCFLRIIVLTPGANANVSGAKRCQSRNMRSWLVFKVTVEPRVRGLVVDVDHEGQEWIGPIKGEHRNTIKTGRNLQQDIASLRRSMGVGLDFWPHQSSPPQATSRRQEID